MKPRIKAQDHSKVVGINKPAAKVKPPLTRGNMAPVGQPTQPDTRMK